MQSFDLCFTWNWEYDADFVCLLETAFIQRGHSFLQVTPENIETVYNALKYGEISFRAFFDRASDSDPAFSVIESWATQHRVFQINPQQHTSWNQDKVAVHLAFYESGLMMPFTYLLSPYNKYPDLPPMDLNLLGHRFAIKPASGGGGEGVVLEATSLEQVNTERMRNPGEKYLLQAQLEPFYFEGRQAWYRVLFCSGVVHSCWWDPQSHVYTPVTKEEEISLNLSPLREIATRIATICRMDLFSSEIAITSADQFVVVDYVNDPIDLRLQSKAVDGVPDAIVVKITEELVTLFEKNQI